MVPKPASGYTDVGLLPKSLLLLRETCYRSEFPLKNSPMRQARSFARNSYDQLGIHPNGFGQTMIISRFMLKSVM